LVNGVFSFARAHVVKGAGKFETKWLGHVANSKRRWGKTKDLTPPMLVTPPLFAPTFTPVAAALVYLR